jgi:pimeloyl-ACP methyl ester carboxylesterase
VTKLSTTEKSDAVTFPRGRFLQTAATAAAAAQFAMIGFADAKAGPDVASRTHKSFASLRQVDAGVLNVGYAEAGPADGPAVILLHGWPYDIHSYEGVTPILASAGYRVIVPFVRGFGTTRFLSSGTFRNGQEAALAVDVIALMDALKIPKATIGGFDWGARTANILAVLWPERCKAIVSVSGYVITNHELAEATGQSLAPAAAWGWWYKYYFSNEGGVLGYSQNRNAFNRLVWKNVSPAWAFDDATFDRTAASFDNPDHVGIVVHDYRWRMSLAKGEFRYDDLARKLSVAPAIAVPTITIASDFDGAAASGASYAHKFSGKYAHRIFRGIGHNVPQEAPQAFAKAVADVDHFA